VRGNVGFQHGRGRCPERGAAEQCGQRDRAVVVRVIGNDRRDGHQERRIDGVA
jgi:hypothetical protein